jgi:AraC-like DNA-binding protein
MPWFAGTLEHLSEAWARSGSGSDIVVDRLTEILMIELVRIQLAKSSSEGYALALSDARVSRALHLLHSQPELPWTIEQLARRVALSRAALAKRFKDALGQTVFQYLTRIRMHRAEVLLRSSRRSLSSIAHQVGYGSDLTFSKAFKRETGMTPGRFRRC